VRQELPVGGPPEGGSDGVHSLSYDANPAAGPGGGAETAEAIRCSHPSVVEEE
jgi:hypothetical protein